jgi:tRNA G18 (ribose-2'-O)-methylase SpoU
MIFTRKKFLSLTLAQQHKKCAELLRSVYESGDLSNLKAYNEAAIWMKFPLFSPENKKEISDQYHWHLKMAGLNLKEHNLLPSIRTGDRVAKESFKPIAIYLDNVRSAYNVGSIIRTNEALRLGTVHFAKNTPNTENDKVVKTSMGASSIVPHSLESDLSLLPQPIIILDTSEEAIPVYDFIFPPSFTLVLGNEEYGVSNESLKLASFVVEVPMVGAKNSINIACAFAIAAAEIVKQSRPNPKWLTATE